MSEYFAISTETTADLPESFISENGLYVQPLFYFFDGETFGGEKKLSGEDFYARMRAGEMPTTSASALADIVNDFTDAAKKNIPVLHLAFSSGLSSTYNNANLAKNQVLEDYPDARIIVIDTLAASMGQGLLVWYAVKLRREGKTIDETAEWIEENKVKLCHEFTVDDLFNLHRGGRVSKAKAVVGTLINVKPMLHIDFEGHLIPVNNVRGRKKALLTLVNTMEEHLGGLENEMIFISHCDDAEAAEFVKEQVIKRFSPCDVMINMISPTIGAHSGPGTVALFYLGNNR